MQRRAWDSPSGDQTGGGGHPREAWSEPHQVVVGVGLWVPGNDAGDKLGGSWSSGELEVIATVNVEAQG